jgi:hypothetical protein
MTVSTAPTASEIDRSDFRYILWSGTKVGVITGIAVILAVAITRLLGSGVVSGVLVALVVIAAAVSASLLPAYFSTARSVQGIAAAAAIGLWGTVVFMAIDIILLRPFKAYPWTWDAISGGSTWWYLPIWWMLGTFLAWMGGIVTAARGRRGGDTAIQSLALPMVLGAIGGAVGLGLGRVAALPVGAGVGYLITLVIFALVALSRRD